MKVAFIGLGAMGAPMAANLLAAGHELRVWNRTAARARPLLELGAAPSESPRELGSSDVLITMVSDGPDVETVALGPDGFLKAAKPGMLWIDCSSISPSTAVQLSHKARIADVEPLDAPVSGGVQGATDGTLSIMVGGTEQGYARAHPILRCVGENLTHVGPNGAGQTAKLVNQLIVGGTIALVAEGLELAAASGCNPDAVRQALAGGFADSRVMQVHGQRMLQRSFAPGFRAALQLKDLRNALSTAADVGVPIPVTGLVEQLFAALCARGHADVDHSGLAILQRELAGRSE